MATIVAAAGGGTWDASTTTTWVGGVAPTAADDVQLNATSGNVTIATGAVCRSLDCTGYTGTLTHNITTNITIGDGTAGLGNIALKLVAGMTYSAASSDRAFIFNSTSATQQTIDTAGKTMGNFTFQGTGSSYKLSSGITQVSSTTTLTLTRGTLDFNGQTCSLGLFSSSNANTRTITLGSAAITLTGTGNAWATTTVTGLTITANTSTITLTGAGATFSCGTKDLNGMSVVFNGTGVQGFSGATNLTLANVTRGAAGSILQVNAGGSLTISNTLTCNGASASSRNFIISNTIGVPATISAATYSVSNIDFRNIAILRGTSSVSGTNILYAEDSNVESGGIGTWVARGTNFVLDAEYTEVYSGLKSMKGVMSTQTQADWGITTMQYPISGSTAYAAQIKVKAPAGKLLSLKTLERDSSATISATTTFGTLTATGGWDTISGTATTAASTVTMGLLVSAQDASQGTFTIYLDEAMLETGSSVSAYSTGSRAIDFSGITSGDVGGNAGITFTTPTPQYWFGAGTNWTTTARWFLGTGGTGGAGRVPLPQDDAIFDANSFSSPGQTVTINTSRASRNLTCTGVTNSPTLSAAGSTPAFYGSITLDPNMTWSITGGLSFAGQNNCTIRSYGAVWGSAITFSCPRGIYTMQDAFTNTVGGITLSAGEINDGGYNITCTVLFGSGTNQRALTLSNTTFTMTASTGSTWNMSTSTSFVFTPGTSLVYSSGTGGTARTWIATNVVFNNVRWASSTGGVTPSTNFTANNLQIDAPNTITQTIATTITFSSLTATGTAGNLITWKSSSAGTPAIVSDASGIVSCDYLSLKDSTATGGATFYAGSHSTNVSGNTGWIFTDAPVTTTTTSTQGGGVGRYQEYRETRKIIREKVYGYIL